MQARPGMSAGSSTSSRSTAPAIAACAEQADLKVLHYDADFERIAELTGQPTQWIVPRGSVS